MLFQKHIFHFIQISGQFLYIMIYSFSSLQNTSPSYFFDKCFRKFLGFTPQSAWSRKFTGWITIFFSVVRCSPHSIINTLERGKRVFALSNFYAPCFVKIKNMKEGQRAQGHFFNLHNMPKELSKNLENNFI